MVCMQVGNVDGLQVPKDVECTFASELTIKLQKSSLSAIQKNEIIWRIE